MTQLRFEFPVQPVAGEFRYLQSGLRSQRPLGVKVVIGLAGLMGIHPRWMQLLRWDHVDLDDGILTCTTKRGLRVFPMPRTVLDMLRELFAARSKEDDRVLPSGVLKQTRTMFERWATQVTPRCRWLHSKLLTDGLASLRVTTSISTFGPDSRLRKGTHGYGPARPRKRSHGFVVVVGPNSAVDAVSSFRVAGSELRSLGGVDDCGRPLW